MTDWYYMPMALLTYAGRDLTEIVINSVNHNKVAKAHPKLCYSYAQQSSSLLYAPIYEDVDMSFEQRINYLSAELMASVNLEHEYSLLQCVPNRQECRSAALIATSESIYKQIQIIHSISQLEQYIDEKPILLIAIDSLIHKATIDILARQDLLQTQYHPEGIAVSEAAIALLLSQHRVDSRQKQLTLSVHAEKFFDTCEQVPTKLITHNCLRKQLFSLLNFQRRFLSQQSTQIINIASAVGECGCCNFLMTLAMAYYYARPNQTQSCIEVTDLPRMTIVH